MHQYYNNPHSAPVVVSALDEPYESSADAATIAHAVQVRESAKREFVERLVQESFDERANPTANALMRILDRQDDAHAKLSLIGYPALRHVQANGITLAEVAMDMDMNLLDLMAFMTKHPDAIEHAKLDMLACADFKVAKWMRDIQTTPRNKEQADNRKVQYAGLLDQCKRMSAEWAQFAQRDQELADKGKMMAINIHLNANLQYQPKQVRELPQDDAPVIEGELVDQSTTTSDEFQDVPIEQVKVQI